MVPIMMPQVGHHIARGLIAKWHKNEGDHVEEGEVILTVESEKAAFEVEAEESGILIRILHREGEEAEVLQAVGYIGKADQVLSDAITETSPRFADEPAARSPLGTMQAPVAPLLERSVNLGHEERALPRPCHAGSPRKTKASPVARKLAARTGVDLGTITGGGPGGRIIKRDVLAVLRAPGMVAPLPETDQLIASGARSPAGAAAQSSGLGHTGDDQVVAFGRIRQVIAGRLALSKQTIPHFYLFLDVDLEEALVWRQSHNDSHGTRITVTDLMVYAVGRALNEFGRLNAHVEGDRIILKARVNIGVATGVDEGILVPVVTDADCKDLEEISRVVKKAADQARRGILASDACASFTVSSLGMFGVDSCLPIINPPESAILGVGAAKPRVVAIGSSIAIRRVTTLSLACDHRAVDGVYASRFLQRVSALLTKPFG